jgi:hypothetical protein
MQFFLFFFELQFFAADCCCLAAPGANFKRGRETKKRQQDGNREKTAQNKARTRKHSDVMVSMYLGFLRL